MSNGYRIDVKDFGPIVRASVDFRPLTVFIGPSNTGKSCLAMLLYAIVAEIGKSVITEIKPEAGSGKVRHSREACARFRGGDGE